MSLLAPVDVAALPAAGSAPAAVVAADQRARSMRVAGFLHVAESLGADVVGFAAAGEAGAEAGRQDSAEDGSEHGEAGGQDADVAFDVDPDAGVGDGVCFVWMEWLGGFLLGVEKVGWGLEANVHDRSYPLISWIKGIRTMLPTVALWVLGEL